MLHSTSKQLGSINRWVLKKLPFYPFPVLRAPSRPFVFECILREHSWSVARLECKKISPYPTHSHRNSATTKTSLTSKPRGSPLLPKHVAPSTGSRTSPITMATVSNLRDGDKPPVRNSQGLTLPPISTPNRSRMFPPSPLRARRLAPAACARKPRLVAEKRDHPVFSSSPLLQHNLFALHTQPQTQTHVPSHTLYYKTGVHEPQLPSQLGAVPLQRPRRRGAGQDPVLGRWWPLLRQGSLPDHHQAGSRQRLQQGGGGSGCHHGHPRHVRPHSQAQVLRWGVHSLCKLLPLKHVCVSTVCLHCNVLIVQSVCMLEHTHTHTHTRRETNIHTHAHTHAYTNTGGIIMSASHNPGGPENDFGIKFNYSGGVCCLQ